LFQPDSHIPLERDEINAERTLRRDWPHGIGEEDTIAEDSTDLSEDDGMGLGDLSQLQSSQGGCLLGWKRGDGKQSDLLSVQVVPFGRTGVGGVAKAN